MTAAPDDKNEANMTEERHIPASMSDCLRLLRARWWTIMSLAEHKEIDAAAAMLDLSYEALRELCQRIERCGASPELTHAVTLCSDLASAIGNKWNPRDKQAEQRVRDELARVKP